MVKALGMAVDGFRDGLHRAGSGLRQNERGPWHPRKVVVELHPPRHIFGDGTGQLYVYAIDLEVGADDGIARGGGVKRNNVAILVRRGDPVTQPICLATTSQTEVIPFHFLRRGCVLACDKQQEQSENQMKNNTGAISQAKI
jgi:hypothetical protein